MKKSREIAYRIAAMMKLDGFEPPAFDSKTSFVLTKLERYIIWLRENQHKYLN